MLLGSRELLSSGKLSLNQSMNQNTCSKLMYLVNLDSEKFFNSMVEDFIREINCGLFDRISGSSNEFRVYLSKKINMKLNISEEVYKDYSLEVSNKFKDLLINEIKYVDLIEDIESISVSVTILNPREVSLKIDFKLKLV